MERKNIAFQYGIHRAPSAANDGELAECVNLIPKNGELVNIKTPKPIGIEAPGETYTLKFIHKKNNYKNYIFFDSESKSLVAVYKDKSTSVIHTFNSEVSYISALGNTLAITSSEGIGYALFKEEEYKWIGYKPEQTTIKFSLTSKFVDSDKSYEITGSEFQEAFGELGNTGFKSVNDDFITRITNWDGALVNSLAKQERDRNNIINPCFVRYAYRMYDGSYIMHSSPILLVPNTNLAPATLIHFTGLTVQSVFRAYAMSSSILYEITKSELDDWKDVITSVDIFMSNEISPRKSDKNITHLSKLTETDFANSSNYGHFLEFNYGSNIKYDSVLGPMTFTEALQKAMPDEYSIEDFYVLDGLEIQNEDYYKQVKETSNFYKVRSIQIENITLNDRNYLFDEESNDGITLNNLSVQEPLTDDYHSHDKLFPNVTYIYNARLNLSNLRILPFNGYDTAAMVMDVEDGSTEADTFYTIYTHIKKENKEIVVKNVCSGLDSFMPMYLFYPDADAYQMTIVEGRDIEDGSDMNNGYIFKLENHPLLNGAVWFSSFKRLEEDNIRRFITPVPTAETYEAPNKIYTSEVNNPFFFPLSGINTVGTGEIIGLASATKALSQGQFGQFPLYVFSSDGIWAMEVGGDGMYISVKPVSRDICNNRDSITQIDNAVIFATDRGMKMIQGSEVILLSANMEYENIDESIYDVVDDFHELMEPDNEEFNEMLKDCRITYDYPNGLLHIYPKEGKKCYVYALDNGEFASYIGTEGDVKAAVPDYPGVILQIGNKLLDFRNEKDSSIRKGVVITRPLTFSDPLAMKVINNVKLIYHRSKPDSKCRYAMFVSNNGLHWQQRFSLRGHSFKYFRFVIFTELADTDALQGMSVMYDHRRINKLR